MSDQPPGDGPENVERLADHRRRRRPSRIRDATDDAAGLAARLAKVKMLLGDAPYEPVGFDGAHYWVLDSGQHLRSAAPRDIGGVWLDSICGSSRYLRERYPRMRNGKPVNGFVADDARRDIMLACHEMGFWEPTNIRGAGAWRGADGDLILHRGDHLWIRGARRALGRLGEFVYIPGPPLPPLPELTINDRPGVALLDRLETFRFARGSFDAMLTFGEICVSIVSGALAFRPHQFIVGEINTGKTTLQLLIRVCLGANGVVDVTDATAAAIWQALKGRSIPICYDEFEAEADPKKQDRILALARQASTGAKLRRGSSGGGASEFPVVSNFICSSVIPPPFNSADASRFLVANTVQLEDAQTGKRHRPPFSLDRLAIIGAQLTRRLADRWEYLNKTVLPEISRLMGEQGYPGRITDLYGTIIGLVGVALHDDIEQMNLAGQLGSFQMQRLLKEALGQQMPEYRRCIDHMAAHRIERNRPTSQQLGELVQVAGMAMLGRAASREQLTLWGFVEDMPEDIADAGKAAQRMLSAFGLRVARVAPGNDANNVVLQVAFNNVQLAEIFEHTRWRTSAESATGGGWIQALRRAPGATISGGVRFRAGVQSRCVQVPIAVVLQRPIAPEPGTVPAVEDTAGEAPGVLH